MREDLHILAACPLFDGVGADDIEALLGCVGARAAAFARGATVLAEGGRASAMGVVLDGAVRVVRNDFYGNRTIQAAVGPGGLFGEALACAGVERMPVSVEAAEDTRVLLMRADRLLAGCPKACAFHGRVVTNLLCAMAQKNLVLNQKLEIASRRTIRDKLMTYLLSQAMAAGSDDFTIPFDRQALADYLGVDRSALSAEIGRLRREGVLDSQRSRFRLMNGGGEG